MKRCTIQIRDEVNIKLEGLDLDVRRALVTAFKYDVPYARYLPAVRLGRWDGKRSEEHTSELPVTLESRMPSSA